MKNFNTIKVALFLLVGLAVFAAGLYHYKTSAKAELAHAVVARDRSESVLSDCGCTEALVKKVLRAPNVGGGSNLAVIVSGDKATADEPVLVGSYEVPTTRRVIEGRNATQRKQEALFAAIKGKCESLSRTKTSPILLLIRRGIERLRHGGCGTSSNCLLFVQTDGEETAEDQIKKLLDGQRSNKKDSRQPLIDNRGIEVVFNGLSQTLGQIEPLDRQPRHLTRNRSNDRAERLRDVWTAVFTDPGNVRFEPFCSAN